MRWDTSVENAWLSLFRLIEFWMGIPYMEPNEVDSTLQTIVQDPRLPGGHIDTEYVHEISTEEDKNKREGVNGAEGFCSSSQGTTAEDVPPWLRKQKSPE